MAARAPLPRLVHALGAVSLLTDLASELIVPLLPLLLRSLGGTMLQLGLLQGLSDLVTAVLKYAAGRLSDRGGRRKPWLLAGYGLSALARPLFALVAAPWQALLVRSLDRVGKGLRSAPRDALLAGAVPPAQRGAAFGVQRAMDHAGALGGGLLAALLLAAEVPLTTVFALALVPGLAAVAVLGRWVPDAAAAPAPPVADPPDALLRLRPFLLVVALGGAAAAVDLFLLARASDLGVPPVQLPLLWALLHLVRAALAAPAGALSDRLGRRALLGVGLLAHAAVLALAAATSTVAGIWLVFALHGLHAAATEGAERGCVADLTGASRRGTAFGIYHAVQGLAALGGAVGLGWLWDRHGAPVAFAAAAAAGLLAAISLLLVVPRPARG